MLKEGAGFSGWDNHNAAVRKAIWKEPRGLRLLSLFSEFLYGHNKKPQDGKPSHLAVLSVRVKIFRKFFQTQGGNAMPIDTETFS